MPIEASVITKLGQLRFITNWGSFILLQIVASAITNWGSFFITHWGKCYYKLGQLNYYKSGQILLQIRAAITN